MILPDFDHMLLFLVAASILILVPGPSVLYIIAKSVEQGYKAGIVSVLGIGIGSLLHVIAAAIGISSIVMASATAFSIIKYIGAAYLIYLGIKKFFEKEPSTAIPIEVKSKKLKTIFYEGILVNTFNPKTAIFFLSFLPQFISVEKGGNASQILFLGILFTVYAILSDTIYVLLSVKLSAWVSGSKKYLKRQKKFMAIIYILLGIITLTMDQQHSKHTLPTK